MATLVLTATGATLSRLAQVIQLAASESPSNFNTSITIDNAPAAGAGVCSVTMTDGKVYKV